MKCLRAIIKIKEEKQEETVSFAAASEAAAIYENWVAFSY